MSSWWWLLILFFVLSPLVWLMPSSRQRGRMDVRMHARRLGVAMQLSRQQWPHWLLIEPPQPCPQYHRGRRAGRSDTWCYWQMEAGQWLNKWREPCADPVLLTQLQSLPADVYCVEASKQMLAICWGERGDTVALERLVNFLQANA